MTTTSAADNASPPKYKVVGTRPLRHDALDKVTGAAKYGSDINTVSYTHLTLPTKA